MTEENRRVEEPLPLSIEEQIDRLCDDLERSMRIGAAKRVEDLLAKVNAAAQPYALQQLLSVEIEQRCNQGESIKPDELFRRFPDLGQAVEGALQLAATMSSEQVDDVSTDKPDRWNAESSVVVGRVAPNATDESDLPRFRRYRIEKVLGKGGFGRVYRAYDTQLHRYVALKVPSGRVVASGVSVDALLSEARAVAKLKHPGLVAVHDVQVEDETPYIVQELIEGENLVKWSQRTHPDRLTIAELIRDVADAVGFAHQHGLIHRDLKPSNILIDRQGNPHVADFGLALHESVQHLRKGEISGTPPYMSPEQVRAETHLLDGRTDIWALGVVLYERLVGRRPFASTTRAKLFKEIITNDPRPPRQWKPEIEAELERICLKCLEKRRSDRYTSAAALVDDLQYWIESNRKKDRRSTPAADKDEPIPSGDADQRKVVDGLRQLADSSGDRTTPPFRRDVSSSARVIPKGLRSFDEHDADFFLQLLPGPRDRDGLPENIRFWKTRIERTDPDETFSVGVLYGPSGCGKSSLVKAGLLPRLSHDLTVIQLEATAHDTEVKLLKRLRAQFSALPASVSLPDALRFLREQDIAEGRKLLLVLDQFEQWLHGHAIDADNHLVRALRQCDGAGVQCLLVVRDDFWMAITRLMRALDIELLQSRNTAAVDLFDLKHGRGVLEALGRAYGALPQHGEELDEAQKRFLSDAVCGLADEGRVVCVRLALFAEMVKDKPWTPSTLKQIGGTQGVGVAFFNETFSSRAANPRHRLHRNAVRAVLKALLPDSDFDIKGHMRSTEELLKASGYAGRPREFEELIRILDAELRLITPTDPEGELEDGDSAVHVKTGRKYYQLTHDYLVHSLQEWLILKQKESRRGRAELRLSERTKLWQRKPENRHLPTLWEYVSIGALTPRHRWTETQRKMMRKAGRVHAVRWGTATAAVLLVGIILQQMISAANYRNLLGRLETAVASMTTTRGVLVPYGIEDLEEFPPEMVRAELERRFADASTTERLSLAYALSHFGAPRVDFLVRQIKSAQPDEINNFVPALGHDRESAIDALSNAAKACDETKDWPYKARLAIVALHLGESALAEEMCQLAPDPIHRTIFIDEFRSYHSNVVELAQLAHSIDDPDLVSGLCLAIGSITPDRVTFEEKKAWRPLFTTWFKIRPEAGTHSAAEWALRRWKVPLPEVPVTSEPRANRDWYVNRLGMTMLRIRAGSFLRATKVPDAADPDGDNKVGPDQKVNITRPFLLCDKEVSRGLFQRFLDDDTCPENEKPVNWEDQKPEANPAADHPVDGVSWFDAVLFCNWLSRQEQFAPCYKLVGKVTIDNFEHDDWRLNREADGYRLPTEAEWEYSCRAGTVTDYAFGDEVEFLVDYSVFGRPIGSWMEVPGTKFPNGWGLFDMSGNAREWCFDRWGTYSTQEVDDPINPTDKSDRIIRGGSFKQPAPNSRSHHRNDFLPDQRMKGAGFRVARTYR